jgi:succinate dehydrogenase / fumarate reductase flavoprotein subunit
MLDSKIPDAPLDKKWETFKNNCKIVSPANKKKSTILVVGTGLAGASAAASLAELGYNVKSFCIQDSPRRAHSIAAQGGINAAKNYQNDGDSVWRLFYDTIKGGDFRAREANVYRLAEVSANIIDQCVAQGVPFAREYGGSLANRTFGGTLVSRTFYARGQTGQQLLLGAYGALMRQVNLGKVQLFPQREMLDLVIIDGKARGIIVRNLVSGEIESYAGDSVILASGGYGNIYYLSTNAKNSNASAAWRCHKRGAFFANPCFVQIHPTCIPVSGDYQSKLTLMSESLRNDGRVWVPKNSRDRRPPASIPEAERDYFLERKYPTYGNLVPRDVASRNAKEVCDRGLGVSESGRAVYLDFRDEIEKLGKEVIEDKYGNLFEMYGKITGEDAYKTPMQIYPAVHYIMGGLWVDYSLMSTIPGLFVLGEANFSDHGANRLGASALMQGLGDGYFIIPYTIGDYLAKANLGKITTDAPEFQETIQQSEDFVKRLLAIKGEKTATSFHRELGLIMWDSVGMSRTETGLKEALSRISQLREDFWKHLRVSGEAKTLNQQLELAGRVADFLELGQLMTRDALERKESCGGHFREESQTPDGEAQRDDDNFRHVAAWQYQGEGKDAIFHQETLNFENVSLTQRSYQ